MIPSLFPLVEAALAPTGEFLTLVGSFLASAFAIVKYSLAQHRSMVDRFVNYLEASLKRQQEVNESFQEALEGLTENVRENSLLLGRVAERLSIE
jgi:hypothetical protein